MSQVEVDCQVEIYTDGGCDPNPGPGGWGAILVSGRHTKEISGSELNTTNNRMELTAAIQALSLLQRPCKVTLYTDSTYLRNGMTRWMSRWQARDWVKSDGNPVENADLWRALLNAEEIHTVDWHWVRGHRGNRWNERADRLATQARHAQTRPARPEQAESTTATERKAVPADLPLYDIYARGCALGNPGPAGYGAIIVGPQNEHQRSGGWPMATNNVMDLWGIIAGLQSLPERARVTIHTPSKYVIDGATRWLPNWERSGWRTQSGQPVKNRELWQELSQVMGDHDIEWQHLSGTASDQRADRAMALARDEAEKQQTGS